MLSNIPVKSTIKAAKDGPLFPFLLLEAKRHWSKKGLEKIQAQSAYAIAQLLDLQFDLKKEVVDDDVLKDDPLVWLLSNQGSIWHVGVAYMNCEERSNRPACVSQYTNKKSGSLTFNSTLLTCGVGTSWNNRVPLDCS